MGIDTSKLNIPLFGGPYKVARDKDNDKNSRGIDKRKHIPFHGNPFRHKKVKAHRIKQIHEHVTVQSSDFTGVGVPPFPLIIRSVYDVITKTEVFQVLLCPPDLLINPTADNVLMTEYLDSFIEKMFWCWGEENPASDRSAIAWSQFKHSDGSFVVVTGDPRYGTLMINEECFGPVINLPSGSKIIHVYPNSYGGAGVDLTISIRGSTSQFLWNDVTPTWETITSETTEEWTYVQIKVVAV